MNTRYLPDTRRPAAWVPNLGERNFQVEGQPQKRTFVWFN